MATAAPLFELTLGERLRTARVRAGLSQQQMADALGVSRPLISAWEHDKEPGPRHRQIEEWAKVTNTPLNRLLALATTPYKRQLRALPSPTKPRLSPPRSPLVSTVSDE